MAQVRTKATADHLFVEVRVVSLDGKGFLDSQLVLGRGMVHN